MEALYINDNPLCYSEKGTGELVRHAVEHIEPHRDKIIGFTAGKEMFRLEIRPGLKYEFRKV